MTLSGGERAGRGPESAPLDPTVESSDPAMSEHEIEIVTVDGETTYRVDGREYADREALPRFVRRILAEGGLGGADPAPGTPPIVNDLTPEGLRELAAASSAVGAGRDSVNPAVDGRRHDGLDDIPAHVRAGGDSAERNLVRASSWRPPVDRRRKTAWPGERRNRPESFSLASADRSDDPFHATTRAIERSIGAIFRWIAYFALIAWSWMEPESLGPFIFLGFLIADFVTWVAEIVLVSLVWRSRPFHAGSVGLSLVGFGIVYGLLMLTESFQVAPPEKDWAHTVGLIAFFFTLCGKTVAIGFRRASDITRGP